MVDARVLQADGIEHAHGRLVHAVRLVTQTSVAGGALEAHAAHVAIRKPRHAGVFLAEAHAAGQQYDG
jgi:hypothetical protein